MSDDKIAEIRARHSKRSEIDQSGCYRLDGFTYMGSLAQSQEDVATLLSEVERLRVLNTLLERNDERRVDEVEWLRAENERVWRRYDIKAQILDDRATLLAEVERFREALTDIANQETTGPYKWQLVVARLCEIAREALEGKQ